MALLADAKTFEPLLPFFRYIAAWTFFVTFVLSWFTNLSIIGIIALALTLFGFVLNLTVAILGQKAKKRLVKSSVPLPRHNLAVLIIDWILFVLMFILSGFQLFAFIFRARSYYYFSVFMSHSYIGALVAFHFQLFFAIVGTKLRKRYSRVQSHYQAETSRIANTVHDSQYYGPAISNGSTTTEFSTMKGPIAN